MSEEFARSTGASTSFGEGTGGGGRADAGYWSEHTRVSLSPVAAPSILGLYGFAAATFMVAANLAGWFGTASSQLFVFPLAMFVGGLAQFMAGMWAYRARDGLATAMHGIWGSFWLGYGVYMMFVAVAVLPAPSASPAAEVGFGYWFIVLAAVTWAGLVAALAVNAALSSVLLTLAVGATLLAIGWVGSVPVLATIAAYMLLVSAVLAYYTASAMMLQSTFGRAVLPVGAPRRAPAAGEGSIPTQPLAYEVEEPGVKHGQ